MAETSESNGDAVKREVEKSDEEPSSKRVKVVEGGEEEGAKESENDNDDSQTKETAETKDSDAPPEAETAPVAKEEGAQENGGSNEAGSSGEAPPVAEAVTTEEAPPTTTTTSIASSTTTPAIPAGLPNGLPRPADPSASATVVNPASIVEERGEVSALYVGRVIGKGGEMIRDLQARSGCRIDVDQNVPPGQPRVITYRGTRKTVDFAKRLVQMLCAENASEASLPLGEAKREYLVVPAQSVGKIIGRGGEMIRELQSRSQAKIQVDHTGASGLDNSEKQVTMTGTEQAVAKAKEMVLFLVANPMMDAMQAINMLVEDKVHRGGVWGSGPPYPSMPNNGHNMNIPLAGGYGGGGGYDQQAPYYGGAPGGGGPGYGAAPPAAYGAPPAAYGAAPSGYQQPPVAAAAASYGQYGAAASGGVEMEIFYAAKNFMGRIIGQKGVTINDLQRRSSCDIQINQDVPPGQECEISIRGTRQGIEMTKQMLREIIDIGPNHPYAGGTQPGGGGGGGGGYQQQQGYGQAPQSYGGFQQQQQQQAPYGHGGYDQHYQSAPYGGRPGGPHGAQAGPYASAMGGYSAPQAYGHPQGAPPAATEWKSATSPDGQVYYYNERTGETQWEKPIGMP